MSALAHHLAAGDMLFGDTWWALYGGASSIGWVVLATACSRCGRQQM